MDQLNVFILPTGEYLAIHNNKPHYLLVKHLNNCKKFNMYYITYVLKKSQPLYT